MVLRVGFVSSVIAVIAYAAAHAFSPSSASAVIAYAASGWGTQNGSFTVPVGQSVAHVLPLTGVTVTARCVARRPVPHLTSVESISARAVFQASGGKTMDAVVTQFLVDDPLRHPFPAHGFEQRGNHTLGGTSLTVPVGYGHSNSRRAVHVATVVATSNDATATVDIGGVGDFPSQTCTFLWQVQELPGARR